MSYYIAKVKIRHEDENGKMKKTIESYLVDAVSVTDAEVKVTKDFEGMSLEYEVSAVSETKIIKVIK
jgi:hypothetical protein|tara:strand:+ start:154 stop:354 length:201 start_codon:yes stop_codon:yes gene_type:complete|eukprot:SAG31_NODE_1138_length_9726_cov_11.750493_5_plen_67_part_00